MKRSKHNLSRFHLTTGDMGQLIPVGVTEVLPGDSVQHNTNVVVRVSPLAAPVMHPVTVRVHHFFAPSRHLWNKSFNGEADDGNGSFEDFITGGEDGLNDAKPPQVLSPNLTTGQGGIMDHLGLKPQAAPIQVNAMPLRAVNAVYNEYYRDQDLAEKRNFDDDSLPNIAWEKDYFSAARPFAQKGPAVTLPVGTQAPVIGDGNVMQMKSGAGHTPRNVDNGTVSGSNCLFNNNWTPANSMRWPEEGEGDTGLMADLSAATSVNINEVRRAFALQRYQEARSRYGSRYTEFLRYLGVTPSDQRLQRPEFLGGGRTQLNFSEILQQAPNTGQQPSTDYGVGDLYGHGIAALRSNRYRRFIEEHGYIVTLLSVRPHAMLQDGAERMWLRDVKEDWFQKELAYIGQQEIKNNEVYMTQGPVGLETFGYTDRYAEYRGSPSMVTNNFRDQLDYWHMARKFDSLPVLNQSFTDCVPTKRIFNVGSEDGLWIMAQHRMVARRMVPKSAASKVF